MNDMNVLPTSYSALNNFETCPRKHYYVRITKEVADPPGEAAQWGSRVHEALELYLRDGVELPTGCSQYKSLADKLTEAHPDADLLVEQQLAVDENFQPTGWWDDNAWFRGIIDVAIINGDTAYIFDWKTGKKKEDFDQLKLFAAMATSHYPDVANFHIAYVWLKSKELTTKSFSRDEARTFWADLVPRVALLENALEHNNWPARPSGLCKRWCPVGKLLCEHCGT